MGELWAGIGRALCACGPSIVGVIPAQEWAGEEDRMWAISPLGRGMGAARRLARILCARILRNMCVDWAPRYCADSTLVWAWILRGYSALCAQYLRARSILWAQYERGLGVVCAQYVRALPSIGAYVLRLDTA